MPEMNAMLFVRKLDLAPFVGRMVCACHLKKLLAIATHVTENMGLQTTKQ